MPDIGVGLLAVVAGTMLCFFGYWALRILLGIWGAVVGFGAGSAVGTWISDDNYLASAIGWIIGLALALVFAALAYLYYAVGVVLSSAAAGFALGAAITAAVGVSWTWVGVTVGLVVGLALAAVAVIADVPLFLLLILSSFGGASIAVTGLMLLTGVLETVDFDSTTVTDDIGGRFWWSLALVALALAGFMFQLQRAGVAGGVRRGWGSAPADPIGPAGSGTADP
ncbi:MAG: hypothetical protein ABW075_05170 [Aeromicrobium sp.]